MAVRLRLQRQAKRFHAMRLLQSDGKYRSGEINLNVTALVDMMTVLVIFLVMQFNATGEMLFVSKELDNPDVENGAEITRVPIVSLSKSGTLYFEGTAIVDDLNNQIDKQNWKIAALEEKLIENRKRYEALGTARMAKLAPQEDPTSTVNVQFDKGLPFGLLKYVLYTCEVSGYGRIRLIGGDISKPTVDVKSVG